MIPVLPTFPITWYVIAALTVSNLLTGYLLQRNSHELQIIELQGEIAVKEDARKTKERNQITEDTTNGWKAALDTTRSYYDKRLRDNAPSSMPGISRASTGADVSSEDPIPSASRVEAECAETTLNLNHIQTWVSQQRELR